MKKYIKKSKRSIYIVVGLLTALFSTLLGFSSAKRDTFSLSTDLLPDLNYIKNAYADVPVGDYGVPPVDSGTSGDGPSDTGPSGHGSPNDGSAANGGPSADAGAT